MEVSNTGLNEVVRVLGALSRGDLTEKITNEYKGTFKRLKDDSNMTVDKLTEIVTQIKDSTESINMASKEIASGNTDLSARTEEQAGNLATAVSVFKLTQQAGHAVAARPAAKHAALPAPRKPATIHQHPTVKPKTAKAAGGGEDWTEF